MNEDLTESEMLGIIIVKEYADGSIVWETNYDHFYMIELLEDLIEEASGKRIEEKDVEEVLEKLKRSGDIFEPKRGFIQKI